MKKLHLLIIRSFIGPFIVTFFIALFVLVMQFLFKYVDDLVGKGLEWYVVSKLLFWASFSFVPMALPLSVLISSIMTYGNLGEHYELVAFKSSGVSLQRLMAPMMIFVMFVGLGAFYFSNSVIPYANLKFGSLLYDVRQQKPGFGIKKGIFYNGLDGYSIRVGNKSEDNQILYDIMIYDHTEGNGNTNVLLAEQGKMFKSKDEQFLVLKLINGEMYQEMDSKRGMNDRQQHIRVKFKEHEVKFDLSTFKLSRTNEELFKDHYSMLSIRQLAHREDTLETELSDKRNDLRQNFLSYIQIIDTAKKLDSMIPQKLNWDHNSLIQNFPQQDRQAILSRAESLVRNVKSYVESSNAEQKHTKDLIHRHQIEWHRKFTLSVACLILFFIGAPLGAIIRKGGLGVPIVVSIFFFIFFHILSTTGEKYVREGVLPAMEGMWMASVILTPIGFFFMRRATADSALFDIETYLYLFKKFWDKVSRLTARLPS